MRVFYDAPVATSSRHLTPFTPWLLALAPAPRVVQNFVQACRQAWPGQGLDIGEFRPAHCRAPFCRGIVWYPSPEFDGKGHVCGVRPCNMGCDNFLEATPPFEIDVTVPRIALLDRVPGAPAFTVPVLDLLFQFFNWCVPSQNRSPVQFCNSLSRALLPPLPVLIHVQQRTASRAHFFGMRTLCTWEHTCVQLSTASASTTDHQRCAAVLQQLSTANCSHLDKALHAQLIGASAVIIADTDDTPAIAITFNTEEQNTLKQTLRIPVGTISKSDGQWLRERLGANAPDDVYLHLDFLNPIAQASVVRAPSCWSLRILMSELYEPPAQA